VARWKECPRCGARGKRAHNFCIACGTRLPSAEPAPPEREPQEGVEQPGGALRALYWFLDLFPGLLRPTVIVASLLAFVAAAIIGAFCFTWAVFGLLMEAIFVGAFAVVAYWAGITWILCGYVCLPAEALAEFDGRKWTILFVLTVLPLALFLALVKSHGAG